jgi:hypothetical protein
MNARRPSLATAALVVVLAAAPTHASGTYESLSELADHFVEHGLEPLPGQSSVLVEGGVVGVVPGGGVSENGRPYLLVTASPPAEMETVGVLVDVGTEGVDFNGLPLPPLFGSSGRHVIVAYLEDADWDGAGLLPLDSVAAYVDLSALAGGSGMSAGIDSAASSPVWMRLIEQSNIPLGLDLEIGEAPDLESARATEYSKRQIPGLQFSAGATSLPGNQASSAGASMLAASIVGKVRRLDEPPLFQRIERETRGDEPSSKRPYTGTIPAYTAEVEGLLLDGVLPGGPAEEAGLREGDLIVEMAGVTITDVYGYSDALDSLEIDVPVTVVFVRDGERLETSLTPKARE